MPIALQFYRDALLTQPIGAGVLRIDREIGSPPVDTVVYLGANNALQYSADDGDAIVVSVVDTDSAAPSDGFAANDLALSTSAATLATATPGQPLSIPGPILGGAANAQAIWIRFAGTRPTPLTDTTLMLTTNLLRESAP